MKICICFVCLFHKRTYTKVRPKSIPDDSVRPITPVVTNSPPNPLNPEESKPSHSNSPQPPPRTESRTEQGMYVLNKDKVEFVPTRIRQGESKEMPVLATEDKVALVRKRLASL